MFALIYDTQATFNVNPSPFITAEFDTSKGYTMSQSPQRTGDSETLFSKYAHSYLCQYIICLIPTVRIK